MHNIWRALKLTFKYKLTIASAMTCAFLVAICWGGNITAVYPLVQISFQGESIGDWHQHKTEEKSKLLSQLRQQPETESRAKEIVSVERELKLLQISKPYIEKYTPTDPFLTIVYLMCFVLVMTYLKSILGFFHGLLSGRLGMLGTLELRDLYFQKLLNYEANYFTQKGVSDSMSRFTGDIGALSSGLSLFYGKLIREPLKMTVCLIGAAIVSWQLLLFTFLFAPVVAFLITWMAKALKRVVRNSMIEMVSMYSQISETFNSIRVVKSFNREEYELEKFHRTNRACFDRGMKIAKYGSLSSPMTECLGTTTMILAVLIGAWLVMSQKTSIMGVTMSSQPLDLGSLILFYGFLLGAADPARRLSDFFVQIQGAVAAADRVYEMVDREILLLDPPEPKELPPFRDKLVFDHVFYSYPKGGELPQPEKKKTFFDCFRKGKKEEQVPSAQSDATQVESRVVLHDINLEIRFGETLAIVGPSGCGKSTLLGLIPRFYDPTSGSVSIDGIPYSQLRMRDLRSQIGMVTQEPILFRDTVFENIRYGVPDASREAVIDAAKKAYADQFVMEELIDGYETNVGQRGGLLSGGQRQRIALARAFLKNPSLFLLDEATSQIDILSEKYIHDALASFVGNRTTIIVTHRLTALRLADRIVVMQDGRIENVGTHQELLQKSPFYSSLWLAEHGPGEDLSCMKRKDLI